MPPKIQNMSETKKPSPRASAQDIAKCRKWWNSLTPKWQRAYEESVFKTDNPTDAQLWEFWNAPVFRMAGPSALFPNVSFELDDLSGVVDLDHLEILVFSNMNITNLAGIEKLTKLKSLFVFSNLLTSIEGVESLKELKEFFCNDNKITSLQPLAGLVHLEKVHCAKNSLESFEGIGKQHTKLTEFISLPNDGVWSSEIMRFETETRIRCKKS